MFIQKISESCVDILFPSKCPLCKIHVVKCPSVVCPKCEDALISGVSPRFTSTEYIHNIASCCAYSGTVKLFIQQLKYRKTLYIKRALEKLLLSLPMEFIFRTEKPDVVIPVPIHRFRRFKRGFNQAEIIVKILAEKSSLHFSHDALVKVINTRPQTGLTRAQRIRNLKNSFSVRKISFVKGKTVLLVDDVMTTGVTLDTCAGELLEAGARKILGFTLARTL